MNNRIFEIRVETNVGNIRKNNEDNFFVNSFSLSTEQANRGYRFVDSVILPFAAGISDGMGGKKQGEKASAIVAENLYKFINEYQTPLSNCNIRDCIKKVNDEVCNHAPKSGATLAMIYATGRKLVAVSIGDSRIFLFSSSKLRQINRDHTLAQLQVDVGLLSPDAAKRSKLRHCLTQYIGIPNEEMLIQADFYDLGNLKKGDWLLICSDGLYETVEEKEIETILSRSAEPATDLMNAALKKGSIDNITVMTIGKGSD